MKRMADGIFRQYGTAMGLTHDGAEKQIRGFFQPVRSKSWQSMVNAATPLGEIPRGQYVYIGPAGTAVEIGDALTGQDLPVSPGGALLLWGRNGVHLGALR